MNVLVIGAHPDDCEFFAAGTALKMIDAGHRVKFVSATNGDAGHMSMPPAELAERRRREIEAADAFLGVEWEILGNHDGRLMPELAIREQLIRIIREFRADVVMSHRPWDYHPDHRNTAVLVQDTAYLVIVPNVRPDIPALRENPLYFHLQDEFAEPAPFRPDVIVPVDDVFDRKVKALSLMPSQFFEWLPFTFGILDEVPEKDDERLAWLDGVLREWMKNPFTAATRERYGAGPAGDMEMIEAFQVCPFGRRPTERDLAELFPFLPPVA